ncbi:MAG: class I SAM-dependent methyltransferase [Promethearchaeota archaeon]
MMKYYSDTLAGHRLERCYEIAPPRIIQYLKAELDFVKSYLKPSDTVLELGCGYGRILKELQDSSLSVVAVDTSLESLFYGLNRYLDSHRIQLVQMDAKSTAVRNNFFDAVVCIQNGISAFKIDPFVLVRESLRITKPEGKCLFSTYSDKIWEDRLDWFRLQAEEELVGELDWERTRRGTIVCKDGFVATTFSENDFHKIAHELRTECVTVEVDSSSLFGIYNA